MMIKIKNKKTRASAGFTLVEVLVAIVILALGILVVSQMTVLGLNATRIITANKSSREILAKGMEVLKLLNTEDALLTSTGAINDTTLAHKADTTNIVGKTLYPLPMSFRVLWTVVGDYPQTGLKTIRMFVFKSGKPLLQADYVRWR
jgi:prepilin-type N-terminal cleavage/methylation domain-containing protein